MILHPRFRSLARFAAGGLEGGARARVAAHLAGCGRCRDEVAALRRASADARATPVPAPPADALERILARRAAGERVVLPAAERAAHRGGRRVLPALAASLVLLVAAASLFVRAPELQADDSELRLLPAQPRAGATVTVEYRATAKLGGEERLVLRARFRAAGEARQNFQIPHLGVAELERTADRTFRGSFRLPDSAVYAVFAVEDARGTRVDANGEAWELLVHAADGRPLADALAQRREDASERNQRLAAEATRELARLYPEHPWSGLLLFSLERSEATRAGADSLRLAHRPRVGASHRRLSQAQAPSPEEMGGLLRYAGAVGDTAVERHWRTRLLREHPVSPRAVQERVFALRDAHRADPARLLGEFERLWEEAGPASAQLAFSAYQTALASGDAAAALRWGERLERHEPSMRLLLVHTLVRVPGAREEGMQRLRSELRRLDEMRPEERMLTQTVDDQRATSRLVAGRFLGSLGQALIASGRTAAGLDTLDRAVEGRWDAALFRTIADTRLATGDTAGAAPLLARVAADPSAPPAFVDSARLRLGRRFRASAWPAQVDSARDAMRAHVLGETVNRGLRGRVGLADAAGKPFRLDAGTETLVAFWSRHCPPSLEQLGRLQAASARLRARGVRVVAVTEEAPSEETRRWLAEQGFTFPAYHDVDGDAARAFENRVTPRYFVLDAAGRIRFDSHAPEAAERAAAVLQALRRERASAR
ncbi:MAG TPA: redoxin domain-containing protein [Longimicrobiaceae bacterium]|jgi:peroxiredoxin